MKILLTNDDGIKAPGLRALLECVPKDARVLVAAPATERSASSHSISLGQKLRVEEFVEGKVKFLAVHGTPADAVKLALYEHGDFAPDLIVSGINQGANTGVSVYYSGTLSAAREGFINGIPAIAISLSSREFGNFTVCQNVARLLIEAYRERRLPSQAMLNVNVPPLLPEDIKGVRITRQAPSRFIEEFVPEPEKEEGKKVYRLAGEIEIYDADGTSDEKAVNEGFISITPLKIDLTDYGAIKALEKWLETQG